MEDEIIDIYIAQSSLLDDVKKEDIHKVLKLTHSYLTTNNNEVFEDIKKNKILTDGIKDKITKACISVKEGLNNE